jgi:hypothetical protein
MCHISTCPMKYSNEDKEGGHRLLDHNPLRSSYDLHPLIDYSELKLLDNPVSNDANSMNCNTDDSNLSIDSEYNLDTTNTTTSGLNQKNSSAQQFQSYKSI